jgi:putative ABC transport system permease protein
MAGYLLLSMMPQDGRGAGLWSDRRLRTLSVLGRLKPSVSPMQAQASLNVIAKRLAEQYPKTDQGISINVVPEKLARPMPRLANTIPLIAALFLALAGAVLVLACINVTNLLMIRAAGRLREMALRTALGASRGRLVRQMLTESLILALLSAVTGICLGMYASGAISSIKLGTSLPLLLDFSFDWRVFMYSMLAAVLTGVLVGIWPALRVSRTPVGEVLKEGGRSGSAGANRHRVRSLLVIAEVAGSLMLLIVAARFVRSLHEAQNMALGFQPDNVLNVSLNPRYAGYDQARTEEFYRELEQRVRAIPGVQSESLAFSVPMGNYNDGAPVFVEGHPLAPGQQPPLVFLNRITPDYFETAGISFMRGRKFTENDDQSAPLVAVVNQTMAAKFWPNEEAIGKRFSIKGPAGPFVEVVGVVHDSRLFGYYSGSLPYFYVPFKQNYNPMRTLQIRSSLPPETLIPAVKQQIQALDPEVPISDVQTMREAMAGANGFLLFRLGAGLTAAMGLLGLVIAAVGIYGVVSSAASQRTREIGVRIALGADKRNILGLILGQGLRLVLIGIAIGLAAAFMLTRAMGSLLVGVTATDPTTWVPVSFLLGAIALVACYIPAYRAMRVSPVVALRYD